MAEKKRSTTDATALSEQIFGDLFGGGGGNDLFGQMAVAELLNKIAQGGPNGLNPGPTFTDAPTATNAALGERSFFPGNQLGQITFPPQFIGPTRTDQGIAGAMFGAGNLMEQVMEMRRRQKREEERQAAEAAASTRGGTISPADEVIEMLERELGRR